MAIMRMLFLTMSLILVITVECLPLQDDIQNANSNEEKTEINYRLPDDIIPTHYDIKIIPYIMEDNFTFDGEVTVDLKVHKATDKILLHSKDLTIDLSAATLKSSTENILIPTHYNYNHRTEIMTIHFSDVLQPETYTLSLKYVGRIQKNLLGFYRSSYTNDQNDTVWVASTQFEATAARRAFPCWDEPALKATFNVSIKHYTNYTALSNMPVAAQSPVDESDGKIWTHFQTTPVMSTYTLAFVVADFSNISNADGTINVWCRKNALQYSRLVLETAEKATAELQRFTNSSYRVPKMDHVAVPEHSSGAMENWGLIIYP